MKKLALIALAFITIQVTAQSEQKESRNRQHENERMQKYQDLTPEEAATLRTKQMTLDFDLTDAQQRDIQEINLENAKMRKAKMEARKAMKESGAAEKPSKEEQLQRKNKHLDHQIATKRKMKAVLNAEQYDKWSEKMEQQQKKYKSKKKHSKKY